MTHFEASKPALSGTSSLTRPQFLILLKPFHQLRTKYPNIWAYGGHPHSNHHMSWALITLLSDCRCRETRHLTLQPPSLPHHQELYLQLEEAFVWRLLLLQPFVFSTVVQGISFGEGILSTATDMGVKNSMEEKAQWRSGINKEHHQVENTDKEILNSG